MGYKIPINITNGDTTSETDIYLKEPLRAISGYADILDLADGVVKRYVYKHTATVEDNWQLNKDGSNQAYIGFYLNTGTENLPLNLSGGDNYLCICDMINGNTRNQQYNYGAYGIASGTKGLLLKLPNITTLEELKEQFLSKNPTIYYVLAEPIIEEINLPKVETLQGDCTLSINTDISPDKTIAQYYKW